AAISSSSRSRPLPQTVPPARARDYLRSLDSSFELVVLIDVRRPVMPVNGNNHCEANRGLTGRDGDRKDRDHHSGWGMRLRSETPERNKIQVRRGEHHLDPDEDENRMSPAQCSEQADAKKGGGNDQETLERRRHRFSSITSTRAPMRAAVRRSPMHCSGQT